MEAEITLDELVDLATLVAKDHEVIPYHICKTKEKPKLSDNRVTVIACPSVDIPNDKVIVRYGVSVRSTKDNVNRKEGRNQAFLRLATGRVWAEQRFHAIPERSVIINQLKQIKIDLENQIEKLTSQEIGDLINEVTERKYESSKQK